MLINKGNKYMPSARQNRGINLLLEMQTWWITSWGFWCCNKLV